MILRRERYWMEVYGLSFRTTVKEGCHALVVFMKGCHGDMHSVLYCRLLVLPARSNIRFSCRDEPQCRPAHDCRGWAAPHYKARLSLPRIEELILPVCLLWLPWPSLPGTTSWLQGWRINWNLMVRKYKAADIAHSATAKPQDKIAIPVRILQEVDVGDGSAWCIYIIYRACTKE